MKYKVENITCKTCHGAGFLLHGANRCKPCNGTGRIQKKIEIDTARKYRLAFFGFLVMVFVAWWLSF